ncbi:hypothetical protein ACQ86D_30225 [Streptomyces galilaeus]
MATLTERIRRRPEGAARKKYVDNLWKDSTEVRRPVRAALSRMAPGLDGCMYCGSHKATDIEHFDPRSHSPLLTFWWPNHLLACSECNSIYKGDEFPVDEDTGEHMLIDPTRDDPFEHLHLNLREGTYKALTPRGQKTLDVLGLNLDERRLPEGRLHARRNTRSVLRDWGRARQDGNEEWMRDAVSVLREQPFADVCQAMLRQAMFPGAELAMGESSEVMTLLKDDELRAAVTLTFPV